MIMVYTTIGYFLLFFFDFALFLEEDFACLFLLSISLGLLKLDITTSASFVESSFFVNLILDFNSEMILSS